MRSLSLVLCECSLSGRGQGHVSNFYIVDLENFAAASRRCTGDINNSSVVGLFMTPITMFYLEFGFSAAFTAFIVLTVCLSVMYFVCDFIINN